jgi:hypothetical protein
MVGETYQVGGTKQNAFCRTKRLISESDCYTGVCQPPVCNQEQNHYQFYTYGVELHGLFGFNIFQLANAFLCEDP